MHNSAFGLSHPGYVTAPCPARPSHGVVVLGKDGPDARRARRSVGAHHLTFDVTRTATDREP